MTFVSEPDLTQNDVILGRGAPLVKFEGNQRFRTLIHERKHLYSAANDRKVKDEIARAVLQAVHERQGRFLHKVDGDEASKHGVPTGTKAWIEVEDSVVIHKIKQAFRDTLGAGTAALGASGKPKQKKQAASSKDSKLLSGNPTGLFPQVSISDASPSTGTFSSTSQGNFLQLDPQQARMQELLFLQHQQSQLQNMYTARQLAGGLGYPLQSGTSGMVPYGQSAYQDLLLRNGLLGQAGGMIPNNAFIDHSLLRQAQSLGMDQGNNLRLGHVLGALAEIQQQKQVSGLQANVGGTQAAAAMYAAAAASADIASPLGVDPPRNESNRSTSSAVAGDTVRVGTNNLEDVADTLCNSLPNPPSLRSPTNTPKEDCKAENSKVVNKKRIRQEDNNDCDEGKDVSVEVAHPTGSSPRQYSNLAEI